MLRSNDASEARHAHQDVSTEDLVRHNEIICKLDLSANADANEYKNKELAAMLADAYENGAEGVKSNKWKAKKFAIMAGLNTKSAALPETVWKTSNVYNAFGWFNDTRLFAVRFMSLLSTLQVVTTGLLKSFMAAAGLFFIVRLSFDIGVVIKGVFYPEGEAEQNLTKMERLKAVILKDDRIYRMLNDLVWFSLNLTAICLSGGLSVAGVVAANTLLTIGGFAFDTMVEMVKWREVTAHEKALADIQARKRSIELSPAFQKVNEEIKKKEYMLQTVLDFAELNSQDKMCDASVVTASEASIRKEIDALKNTSVYREYNKFSHIETKLTESLEQAKRDRLRVIGLVAMVCIGAALTMFPMSLPVGLLILGAAVSFIGGSVICGFGDRVSKALKTQATVEEVNAPEAVEAESERLLAPNANVLLRQHSSSSTNAVELASPKVTSVIASTTKKAASPSNYGLYARGQSFDFAEKKESAAPLKIAANAFN